MKKVLLTLVLMISLAATVGAAPASAEQMFRIELTVHENHTFTYLEIDTVKGSPHLPLSADEMFERYEFTFHDAEQNILHSEDVYVYFPEHTPRPQPGGSTMASTYVQIPVSEDVVELRILHEGRELERVNLVEMVCTPIPTSCDPYCDSHGMGPSCQDGTNTLWLVLGILIIAGLLIAGVLLYRRRNASPDISLDQESGRRRRRSPRRRRRRRQDS